MNMATKMNWILALLLLLVVACSPKTGDKTSTSETEEEEEVIGFGQEEEEEGLSPCPKFRDAPYPDEVETNYVLYRDALRLGDVNKAYQLWQEVYKIAPAADGKRNTVYSDGIYFYKNLAAGEEDPEIKEQYIKRIFSLYDQIEECYPEGGYVPGAKAFDLYYDYPDRSTPEEIYGLFKQSIDIDGEDASDFVINPFTNLLVQNYLEDKISMEEAQEYQQKIMTILEKGLANCKGVECERWKIVQSYAPARLEAFETVKGFYDCDYFKEKYYSEFEENPTDCDVIRTVYSRLIFGGCSETDALLKALIKAGNEHCREAGVSACYDALRAANYSEAISCLEEAIEEEEDQEKKATYTLLVAKIYYAHLKNFSKARTYARKAGQIKPNWGEPYLLIGRLYASSGPLCGPGRGWDSQIVVWAAIDKWNYAKSIDPEARAEANKWIGKYRQFMPSKEDIFIRNLTEGSNFYIGCWIKENTKIRAAP